MKQNLWVIICLAMGLLGGTGCTSSVNKTTDYAAYVNPFIGTGGHGHTHPGAMVPHGMIQPGPDTRIHGWDACSGYYYEDTKINGFAHTRLSGTGCADFGDFLLMPTVGEQHIAYVGEKEDSNHCDYASVFSHEREQAEPGYYAVFLDRYRVRAELTATERTALHRYTFPASDRSGFILDLDYAIQEQTNQQMEVEVVNETTVRAYKRNVWWAYRQDLYFYAEFSKPFSYEVSRDTVRVGTRTEPRCKLLLNFSTAEGEQVLVKAAVSSVGYEGAEKNLKAEMPAWDFEGTRQAARQKWNDILKKIDIRTTDAGQRTIFYTGLYHAHFSPNLFQDVDGRYLGMDLEVHQGDVNDPMYSIFSLWDTFRALHPLVSIIDPHQNEAYIRSLIRKGTEGGLVPKWDCVANYTGCMIGYHIASLVADAYTKGYRNFDVKEAYKACLRVAEYDTTGIAPVVPRWLYPYIMPVARYYKNEWGYVPCDKDNEAVAKALEYAYDDWCISILAEALGDTANAGKYAGFAKGYENYFDPETRFMRGKDSEGKWRVPFDPRRSTHRADDYCEGNAYQWSWFVPHDIEGLAALLGGEEAFVGKLDSLFMASSEMTGEEVSADISGLIGQYAHGNEPSHHITHMYNYVGRPWRTQELVDSVLQNLYFNAPDGLSGNEDCGQMSAWYILNSMGFYQVCPGKPVYSVGRPLFDEVTLRLAGDKTFVIRIHHNSRTNKYIKSVRLNGKPLEVPFFTHDDLVCGGTMEITMSPVPTAWGTRKRN
ncbi:GH92 family glycosyl hydrolase [uncultured Bacteroides sp.]|uniref:GH92 family glycosyl hydrolase n=1 Tax=uncultured Bacteroides sp. TaxID=162156 RepID=UPI0025B0481E|nr:GH92 family glycosyl hydrolase [uncultured Bacteroides sp.]